MNTTAWILLFMGIIFGCTYAAFIIFGSARTRRNRKIVQRQYITSHIPTLLLDADIHPALKEIEVVSLSENTFLTPDGTPIDVSRLNPHIAIGESDKYPGVKSGDLVCLDEAGNILYAFDIRAF